MSLFGDNNDPCSSAGRYRDHECIFRIADDGNRHSFRGIQEKDIGCNMAKPVYTLIDYVRWMGAFTFEEKPFCDADALVLCEVIYFEIFDSGTSPGKTLRELIQPAPIHDASIVKRLGGGMEEHPAFIQSVSESRRYGEVRVKSYADTLDHEKAIQFAAASFLYKSIFNFIAFRGTDDTIAGWKEDFMISFTKTTAQDMALEFTMASLTGEGANYIGGHSKGGNMALYAASMLPDELQNRLNHVYDLDGPGFCKEVFDLKNLDRIREKTTFIIPEFSVIGKLFEPDFPDKKIVASSETAVMQHELLSWGTSEKGLQTVPENDPRAIEVNRIIDEWVEKIPQADRETFVNELFGALEEDGAKTISDLMKNDLDGFEKLIFRVGGTSETTKKAAAALPEQALFGDLLHEFREKGFWKFVSTNRLVQSLILIACGVLVVFASDGLLDVVTMILFAGLTVIQIAFTFRRLIENHWKVEAVSERLQLCLIMIALTLCLFFRRATVIMGGVVFLIIAFSVAVYTGFKAKNRKHPFHIRLLSILECLAANIYGFSFLIIPQDNAYPYTVSIGFVLIIDGLVRILFAFLESRGVLGR